LPAGSSEPPHAARSNAAAKRPAFSAERTRVRSFFSSIMVCSQKNETQVACLEITRAYRTTRRAVRQRVPGRSLQRLRRCRCPSPMRAMRRIVARGVHEGNPDFTHAHRQTRASGRGWAKLRLASASRSAPSPRTRSHYSGPTVAAVVVPVLRTSSDVGAIANITARDGSLGAVALTVLRVSS